jgi:hypothetical protein
MSIQRVPTRTLGATGSTGIRSVTASTHRSTQLRRLQHFACLASVQRASGLPTLAAISETATDRYFDLMIIEMIVRSREGQIKPDRRRSPLQMNRETIGRRVPERARGLVVRESLSALTFLHRPPMKSLKSNTKISVGTKFFFEASTLRPISDAS